MLDVRYGDYSIRWLDDRNYVVIRHGKNEKGDAVETRYGYFAGVDGAVKRVAKLEADHAPCLAEWLERYKQAAAEVIVLVNEAMNGKRPF